ncbi:MAG: plasmid pRiA4b ORF-3 family protein, partial [Anaerolineae bacterium]
CLAGANACPPEGSGGSRGYAQFLESLRDRTRPMRLTGQGWIRPPYERTPFDIDKVNAALAALKYE